MYTARLFENTGFNAANIPDSKDTVMTAAISYTDVVLDITHNGFLSSINVPANFGAVDACDYVMIWGEGQTYNDSYCYFASMGGIMPASDVATLSLVPDWLNTAGGINGLAIIDGITTRSTYALMHVAPEKLTSGDPYLAPSETMTLLTEWMGEGDEYKDFIESTIDIPMTAQKDEAITAVATLGMGDVTYPVPVYAEQGRFATYYLTDGTTNTRTFKAPGSMLFAYDGSITGLNDLLAKGLAKIRGMGLESAILHCSRIPTKYAEAGVMYDVTTEGERHVYLLGAFGKWSSQQTLIDLHQLTGQDAKSQRIAEVLNFSEYAKYGIMSASGEQMEADPKDLMTTTNPKIRMVGDPRLDGRPYFRFEKVNNDKTDDTEFFRSCISGLPWKQTQLVFAEASGNALNTARYQASRSIADLGYQQAQRGIGLQKEIARQNYEQGGAQQILNLTSAGIDGALGTLGTDMGGGGMFNGVQGLTSNLMQWMNRDLAYAQQTSQIAYNQTSIAENYAAQKMADALSYGIQQNVVVPSVMFPYNTETLRDFYGNGVLVYRYWYSQEDAERIARIIKAYGVKYTMKTNINHFIPEQGEDYCYVETSGVTLGGLPQWESNAIAAQLNGGVRIWNTRPYHIT